MRIQRIRLTNFRQHELTELELGTGLTGIIGPNGAGKTTLLEAIAWAMYGMPAARGSRETIRRRNAPPRSKVEVELQFALGQGPCIEAYEEGRPVLEPNLTQPARPRWLAFTGPALDAGVRAVFGFPLRVGAVRLGALNLYRDRTGPLSDEQHADALVLADVAAELILMLQAHAAPGALPVELETGADFQYVVHQASGMVAVQLGVEVAEAFVRLKAHAFANGRALTDVARDVVGRRLRFDPEVGIR